MRTDYYHQLQRQLEPERMSIQSKAKQTVAHPQQNSAARGNGVAKPKKELVRQQPTQESAGSSDTTALIQSK